MEEAGISYSVLGVRHEAPFRRELSSRFRNSQQEYLDRLAVDFDGVFYEDKLDRELHMPYGEGLGDSKVLRKYGWGFERLGERRLYAQHRRDIRRWVKRSLDGPFISTKHGILLKEEEVMDAVESYSTMAPCLAWERWTRGFCPIVFPELQPEVYGVQRSQAQAEGVMSRTRYRGGGQYLIVVGWKHEPEVRSFILRPHASIRRVLYNVSDDDRRERGA